MDGHESPHRSQRFAERAHDDIDIVEHVQVLGRAGAGGSQHADAVSFVYVNARAVKFCQSNDAAQIGNIAFHAEHAFRHDQDVFLRTAILQAAFQVLQIVMPEAHRAGRRAQRALHQAGVQVMVAQ